MQLARFLLHSFEIQRTEIKKQQQQNKNDKKSHIAKSGHKYRVYHFFCQMFHEGKKAAFFASDISAGIGFVQ